MFKVFVSYAFIAFVWAQNDYCKCGYKYIPKNVLLDPRHQYNRPRRWLEERPLNNTNFYEESLINYDFTNVTARSKNLNVNSRRIGGMRYAVETGINEFPMMAAIYKGDSKGSDNLFAGGTIISNRYILTAAHVLVQMQVNQTFVIVGEHHRHKNLSSDMQTIKAAKFIIHNGFQKDTNDYDIAIIELEKDIKFSDRVGPVCLPFKYVGQDFAGSTGTYLGWGPPFPSGPVSDVLRKVDVNVLSQDKCRINRPEMTERQMCTYTAGRDSCEYDSGGPFLYTDPITRRLFIIGIISFGVNSNTPAIRAAKYMLHPNYDEDRSGGMYDIGIIKLENNINKCLNQRTVPQSSNPSNSQNDGTDWGLPLPPLNTPWNINPDQCFDVFVLNDHQMCERTSSELNCNDFVRSILEDHIACPTRMPFMGPPIWRRGYGPSNRPNMGPRQPTGPTMGPPRPTVPQPPQLCKKNVQLPANRGLSPSPSLRPMVCCVNQRNQRWCEVYKGRNVPIPYYCKVQYMP